MMTPFAPNHGARPPRLDRIYTDGYHGQVSPLHQGASGLTLAEFRAGSDPRHLVSNNSNANFALCLTRGAHQAQVHSNGKLLRSGWSPAGTTVIIEPGARSEVETVGELHVLFTLIPMALVEHVMELAEVDRGSRLGLELVDPRGRIDNRLVSLMCEISKEATAPGPFSSLRTDILSQMVVIHLIQNHSSASTEPSIRNAPIACGGLAPAQLRRVCEFMDAGIAEPVRLSEISAVAGCSPTHFSRAFKQSTGKSPFAWLLERRIDRAMELLRRSRLPVVDIALAVGFSAQPQFTTAFRRVTGSTPAAWRRINGAGP